MWPLWVKIHWFRSPSGIFHLFLVFLVLPPSNIVDEVYFDYFAEWSAMRQDPYAATSGQNCQKLQIRWPICSAPIGSTKHSRSVQWSRRSSPNQSLLRSEPTLFWIGAVKTTTALTLNIFIRRDSWFVPWSLQLSLEKGDGHEHHRDGYFWWWGLLCERRVVTTNGQERVLFHIQDENMKNADHLAQNDLY